MLNEEDRQPDVAGGSLLYRSWLSKHPHKAWSTALFGILLLASSELSTVYLDDISSDQRHRETLTPRRCYQVWRGRARRILLSADSAASRLQ